MKSMTGFGRAEGRVGGFRVVVELSSVNRRGLEFQVSVPRDWAPLERAVPKLAGDLLARGSVQGSVRAEWEDQGEPGGALRDRVVAELGILRELAEAAGIEPVLTGDTVERIRRRVEEESGGAGWDEVEEGVVPLVLGALQALAASRQEEGGRLRVDMVSRVDALAAIRARMADRASGVPERFRAILLERLAQSGLAFDPADDRVIREVALVAEKADVTEEITRLGGHLDLLAELLDRDEPSGRQLEFTLQEVHREVNTIGSKSQDAELSRLVIEAKQEIDRLREQAANVE